MSRLALTPTNVPASATAIDTPTLKIGDLYYNTTTGLMVYNGTAWTTVGTASGVSEIDAGVFDSIAIDHTPYAYEEKVVPFEVAPTGAIGLEFALPVLWQNLVVSGLLSAIELWNALSLNPAKSIGIAKPKLSTLFDPSLEWLANDQEIASQARNSNYIGRSIIGKVL